MRARRSRGSYPFVSRSRADRTAPGASSHTKWPAPATDSTQAWAIRSAVSVEALAGMGLAAPITNPTGTVDRRQRALQPRELALKIDSAVLCVALGRHAERRHRWRGLARRRSTPASTSCRLSRSSSAVPSPRSTRSSSSVGAVPVLRRRPLVSAPGRTPPCPRRRRHRVDRPPGRPVSRSCAAACDVEREVTAPGVAHDQLPAPSPVRPARARTSATWSATSNGPSPGDGAIPRCWYVATAYPSASSSASGSRYSTPSPGPPCSRRTAVAGAAQGALEVDALGVDDEGVAHGAISWRSVRAIRIIGQLQRQPAVGERLEPAVAAAPRVVGHLEVAREDAEQERRAGPAGGPPGARAGAARPRRRARRRRCRGSPRGASGRRSGISGS